MYTNQIEASEMGQHTLHISPAAEHLKWVCVLLVWNDSTSNNPLFNRKSQQDWWTACDSSFLNTTHMRYDRPHAAAYQATGWDDRLDKFIWVIITKPKLLDASF